MKNLFRLLVGDAKDPMNPGVFKHLTLVAIMAWVGLGADGLSSVCYGPEEAFDVFLHKGHGATFMALPLGLLMVITVWAISAVYCQIVELFPTGGGGYLAATRLLGSGPGLLSGAALLVDYVLTIAISCASAAHFLTSILPADLLGDHELLVRITAATFFLTVLIILNMRGVKESIMVMFPIFVTFLGMHLFVIIYSFVTGGEGGEGLLPVLKSNASHIKDLFVAGETDVSATGLISSVEAWGVLVAAFVIGAGTFTGIEAVSNSMQILREPKDKTAQRTMVYMGVSLAFVAIGLLFSYQIWHFDHLPKEVIGNKTFNVVLFEQAFGGWGTTGKVLAIVGALSSLLLLKVAAQAGFVGGPRMLAIMAIDNWVPSWFGKLSDRLVVIDGVLVMGGAALLFVLFTQGNVQTLVIFYAINVFITFFFSALAMTRHWWIKRKENPKWLKRMAISGLGMIITGFTVILQFTEQLADRGWIALVITAGLIVLCLLIKRHYRTVRKLVRKLDGQLLNTPLISDKPAPAAMVEDGATAVILVSGYNGLGIHALLTTIRLFPGHFKNFVFISVGVVDYGKFKGVDELENLKAQTQEGVDKYVAYANKLGYYAEGHTGFGTDLINEIETLCGDINQKFPKCIFFGGHLVFPKESFWTRMLHHNIMTFVQRRLHLHGLNMIILPVKVY